MSVEMDVAASVDWYMDVPLCMVAIIQFVVCSLASTELLSLLPDNWLPEADLTE